MQGEGNNKKAQGEPQPTVSAGPSATSTNTSSVASNPATKAPVEYKSSDIGVKTTVKTDPFAKHKKEQARQKEERKKIYLTIGLAAVAIIIIIALLVWVISHANSSYPSDVTNDNSITDTEITSLNNAVTELGDSAMKAYSSESDSPYATDGDLAAATEVFDGAISAAESIANQDKTTESLYYANQLKLQKMGFYMNRGLHQEAIDIGEALNANYAEQMIPEQQANLYMLLSSAYSSLENETKATEYQIKFNNLSIEAGGYGGR